MKIVVSPARPSPTPAPQVDVVFIPERAAREAERPSPPDRVPTILGVAVPPRTVSFDRW